MQLGSLEHKVAGASSLLDRQTSRSAALLGWTMGAVLAMGAYFGALVLYPAAPTSSMMASLSASNGGSSAGSSQVIFDPITTASITRQDRLATDALARSADLEILLDQQAEAIERLTQDVGNLSAPLGQIRARLTDLETQQGVMVGRIEGFEHGQEMMAAALANVETVRSRVQDELDVATLDDPTSEQPAAVAPQEGRAAAVLAQPLPAIPEDVEGTGQVVVGSATPETAAPALNVPAPTPPPLDDAEDADLESQTAAVDNMGGPLAEPQDITFERRQSTDPNTPSTRLADQLQPNAPRIVLPSPGGPDENTPLLRDPSTPTPPPSLAEAARVAVAVRPLEPGETEIALAGGEDLGASVLDMVVEDIIAEETSNASLDAAASTITGSVSAARDAVAEQTLGSDQATIVTRSAFAVDLGGVPTLEEIDRLWLQRVEQFDNVLAGMTPRILLRQTSSGTLDLRLLAGPIDDAADAALKCAQLVAIGLDECLPSIYDGQLLSLRP